MAWGKDHQKFLCSSLRLRRTKLGVEANLEEMAEMLTYEDCVGLSDLTEDEIEAIAEHEHIPEIVAAELGSYLVHTDDGVPKIRRIILDDIELAQKKGDAEHAITLKLVLKHFVDTHPQAALKT
jgi:hypothetical protein